MCFITLILTVGSGVAMADATSDALGFNTRDVVKMKLWYDGMGTPELQAKTDSKSPKVLSEELTRALDKADF